MADINDKKATINIPQNKISSILFIFFIFSLNLVGVEGLEPSASRSQTERSTTELHPVESGIGIEPM